MTSLVAALLTALLLVPGSDQSRAGAPAPSPPVDAGSGRAAGGVWPILPGRVVAAFDPADSPWLPAHRGVDLLAAPGVQVRAALAGRVTYAGRLAGRGVVVVDHGQVRTTYEPVTAGVTVGDPVATGEPIGVVEAGAGHCAPATCLHWGLLRGETYLDPLSLLAAVAVRLLPLGGPAGEAAGDRVVQARG